MRRRILIALGILAAVFVVLQLVPYGHDHGAPATTKRAQLDPAAARLARGACMDCHSNQTTWPWYSNVAPMSWLIQGDVDEGRAALNFSEWDRPQEGTEELIEVVEEGEMPPLTYTLLHPDARLTDEERATLIAALQVALADAPPPSDDDSGPG